jgi:hypothetical protein
MNHVVLIDLLIDWLLFNIKWVVLALYTSTDLIYIHHIIEKGDTGKILQYTKWHFNCYKNNSSNTRVVYVFYSSHTYSGRAFHIRCSLLDSHGYSNCTNTSIITGGTFYQNMNIFINILFHTVWNYDVLNTIFLKNNYLILP